MLEPVITYFDFAQLDYASYFLTGLMEAEREKRFRFRVSRRVPELAQAARMNDWRDLLFSTLIFQVQCGAKSSYFCIDTRDSHSSNRQMGRGYHLPLLAEVDWYFKINYKDEAVQTEPELAAYAQKIIPLGPFFPIQPPARLLFRPRLRPAPNMQWTWQSTRKRAAQLRHLLPLERFRNFRLIERDTDIFLVLFHYGGKHTADDEARLALMQELRTLSDLRTEIGFAATVPLTSEFAEFRTFPDSFPNYMRRQARSKIGIYVRGLHECVSFKLGQLLALGLPIVGQPIHNNRSWYYQHDYFAEQFSYETPPEIARRSQSLLKDADTLRKWGLANIRTFEKHFAPRPVVEPILQHVL
jgi:hypothetical protein